MKSHNKDIFQAVTLAVSIKKRAATMKQNYLGNRRNNTKCHTFKRDLRVAKPNDRSLLLAQPSWHRTTGRSTIFTSSDIIPERIRILDNQAHKLNPLKHITFGTIKAGLPLKTRTSWSLRKRMTTETNPYKQTNAKSSVQISLTPKILARFCYYFPCTQYVTPIP